MTRLLRLKRKLKGRKGAVAIEVALLCVIALPALLALADFLIYTTIQSQATSSVQTMASYAQASIPNGTDTSKDEAILNKGKAILVLGKGTAATSVARADESGVKAITWTASMNNWSPNFTGLFPANVTKRQTVYKQIN